MDYSSYCNYHQLPYIIKNEIIEKILYVMLSNLKNINYVPTQIINKHNQIFLPFEALITVLYDEVNNCGVVIEFFRKSLEYYKFELIQNICFFDDTSIFFDYHYNGDEILQFKIFDDLYYFPYMNRKRDEYVYDNAIFLYEICKCYFNSNIDFVKGYFLTKEYSNIAPICYYIFIILDGIEYKKDLIEYNQMKFIKNKLNKTINTDILIKEHIFLTYHVFLSNYVFLLKYNNLTKKNHVTKEHDIKKEFDNNYLIFIDILEYSKNFFDEFLILLEKNKIKYEIKKNVIDLSVLINNKEICFSYKYIEENYFCVILENNKILKEFVNQEELYNYFNIQSL